MDDLKPGAFYWAKPAFDVDFTPSGVNSEDYEAVFNASWSHWRHAEQPALFVGYDSDRNEQWVWLGCRDDAPWPAIWIGEEIKQVENGRP